LLHGGAYGSAGTPLQRNLGHHRRDAVEVVAIGFLVRLEPVDALADERSTPVGQAVNLVIEAGALDQQFRRTDEGHGSRLAVPDGSHAGYDPTPPSGIRNLPLAHLQRDRRQAG